MAISAGSYTSDQLKQFGFNTDETTQAQNIGGTMYQLSNNGQGGRNVSLVNGGSPGGSSAPGGGAPSFNNDDLQKAIQSAIKQQQDAVKPAVDSFQASIPEIQQKYAQTSQQLQAQQAPLNERYKTLIDSIKNQGTQQVNQQTRITNNELGKRGITGDSTLAQQEIQNAVTPLQQQNSALLSNANLDQTQANQQLNDAIANLTPQQTSDLRAIQNAIAQLQSGAAQTGANLGGNLYSTQLNANVSKYNTDQQAAIAQQQAAAQAQQQAFANNLASGKLANETRQTNYDTAKPYAGASGGFDPASLQYIQQLLGGGGSGLSEWSTAKPSGSSNGLNSFWTQ